MAEHYVANLKIERVIKASTTGRISSTEMVREGVEEYLHVTLKADTVEDLKRKLEGHIGLVE